MSPRKVDVHAKTRNKRKPPRGMYINNDSLMAFASCTQPGQGDSILKKLDGDLVELKRQVSM
jgi:hypothetical protein